MKNALQYAYEFYLTAAAQKNRNYLAEHVHFADVPFAMEEVLFDPQTSGGLLLAVHFEAMRLGLSGLSKENIVEKINI